MALVQSAKTAGIITVEATSPGLTPATATVSCKPIELRPQVDVWERSIPRGVGITGLWRPLPEAGPAIMAMFLGSPRVFTLTQDGGTLTGTVEGPGGFFGGDDRPVPIVDGIVEGDRVAFKSGTNAFEGRINGDQIELQRSIKLPFERPNPKKEAPNRPAIGPAPDGSDPSIDFSGMFGSSMPVVLKRAER